MSKVALKIKKRERYRSKLKNRSGAIASGKGSEAAREATRVNLKTALALKKVSSPAMREFEKLDLEGLKTQLGEVRKELFNLRFRQATGQLENSSQPGRLRKRVARLLTLIRQKEVVS
ncbi:MAG: 50S ribosomal protein L29 [Desulfovibrio sp.]|jgi:large subunit ribosomal protein L29|nr:50S ribosomal protein L29 [Desulfovibrio sp.]